ARFGANPRGDKKHSRPTRDPAQTPTRQSPYLFRSFSKGFARGEARRPAKPGAGTGNPAFDAKNQPARLAERNEGARGGRHIGIAGPFPAALPCPVRYGRKPDAPEDRALSDAAVAQW